MHSKLLCEPGFVSHHHMQELHQETLQLLTNSFQVSLQRLLLIYQKIFPDNFEGLLGVDPSLTSPETEEGVVGTLTFVSSSFFMHSAIELVRIENKFAVVAA